MDFGGGGLGIYFSGTGSDATTGAAAGRTVDIKVGGTPARNGCASQWRRDFGVRREAKRHAAFEAGVFLDVLWFKRENYAVL